MVAKSARTRQLNGRGRCNTCGGDLSLAERRLVRVGRRRGLPSSDEVWCCGEPYTNNLLSRVTYEVRVELARPHSMRDCAYGMRVYLATMIEQFAEPGNTKVLDHDYVAGADFNGDRGCFIFVVWQEVCANSPSDMCKKTQAAIPLTDKIGLLSHVVKVTERTERVYLGDPGWEQAHWAWEGRHA